MKEHIITEDIKIIKGDCLEVMKELPSESIDLVLTDPPYGTTQCKWDIIIPFDDMWEQLNRLSKKRTPQILFGTEPFSSFLRTSNIKNYKYDWIWEKTTATGFLNSKRRPLSAHEIIHVFSDGSHDYYPIKTSGHERKVSSSKHKRNSVKTDIYGEHNLTGYDSTERYPRSVIKFKTDKQKIALHPTQKPVALLEYLIKTYTNEGDTVLDFTAGSFSTAIACINTNRKFIGIEKDDKYFNIGHNRIITHIGH